VATQDSVNHVENTNYCSLAFFLSLDLSDFSFSAYLFSRQKEKAEIARQDPEFK